MANEELLRILKRGSNAWNTWRSEEAGNPYIDLRGVDLSGAHLDGALLVEADLRRANLRGAHLTGADLSEANLSEANLYGANLRGANLSGADLSKAALIEADLGGADLRRADLREADVTANLSEADLRGANLQGTDLTGADLSEANLSEANLYGANLRGANLSGADLSKAYLSGADLRGAKLRDAELIEADLSGANLNEADLSGADLTRCRVYGVSAWGLTLSACTKQQDLVITPDQPRVGGPLGSISAWAQKAPGARYLGTEITTDDIEVAQFLYLLIHNEKLRKVINTLTSKVVLILGRFSEERKAVLDAMRVALRERDLLPIIFDFSIPVGRNVTETVKVLAGLASFVIADLTDATEVRAELHGIVPLFPSLAVQPILLRGQSEFVSMPHLRQYPWVLPSFEYDTTEHLLANLVDCVVAPAEAKVRAVQRPQPPAPDAA